MARSWRQVRRRPIVLSTLGGHKSEMGKLVILPKIRDPRFITVRRGGTLQDDDHRLLAMWAPRAQSTFCTSSSRCGPRTRGPARRSSRLGMGARRDQDVSVPRFGRPYPSRGKRAERSRSARGICCRPGRSGGACRRTRARCCAYAIKAARAAAAEDERGGGWPLGVQWQRAQLSHEIRELVLDDSGCATSCAGLRSTADTARSRDRHTVRSARLAAGQR